MKVYFAEWVDVNDKRRACGGRVGVFETSHTTKETRHKTHKTRDKMQDTRDKTQDTRDNMCETRHATRHVLAGWEEGTVRREKGRKSALKSRKARACPAKGRKKARITHEKWIQVCMSGLMSEKTDTKQGKPIYVVAIQKRKIEMFATRLVF